MPHKKYSLEDVAEYLHISTKDVNELVRSSQIPFERQGGRPVFMRMEVDAWASQRILGLGDRQLTDFHRTTSAKAHDLSDSHAIITELLQPAYIEPAMHSRTKASILRDIIKVADRTELVNYPEDLHRSLLEREQLCTTALAGRLALLHPQHHDPYMFEDSLVVLGRTVQAIPFGAPDGRTTDLFFLICCQDDRIHLHVLARLCMICHHTDALLQLREADGAEEMYEAITRAEAEVIKAL